MVDATHVESTRAARRGGAAERGADAAPPVAFEALTETELQRLKALADPTRWRVLAFLAAGPRCVCAIQAEVGVPANLLSHHLKALREAGLVHGTRRGRWIDYRACPDALADLARRLGELAVPPLATPVPPAAACGTAVRRR